MNAVAETSSREAAPPVQPWRAPMAAAGLLLAWVLFLYRDTAMAMFTIWMRSETFTHCLVIPPIVAWLMWRQRGKLAQAPPVSMRWALLPVAVVGMVWLLGELTAINAVTQLALVALIVLTVPALFGVRATRIMAFPLAYLFLAVPIGEFVMPYMMERTADVTVMALRATGIVVYREGLQFMIPSGNWSVVEACSGVRYLIASFTVGLLFAYLNYRSLKKRLLFVAVSIAVPVVANWLRAYMIVMLGHLSGNKIATGVDHLVYGWVFFGIVIMIMFAIGARWSDDMDAPVAPAAGATPFAAAPGANLPTAATTLLFAVVAALPVMANSWILRGDGAPAVNLVLPAQLGPWRAAETPLADWKPAFENPSAETRTNFARDGRTVGVYIGYYRNQNYQRKLVGSSNVLVRSEDKAWSQVASGARTLAFDGRTVDVRSAELRAGQGPGGAGPERLVVWRWYWIGGRLTASDIVAKLMTAWSRLTGAGDDSAVVMLYAAKDASADALLSAFAADGGAAIHQALDQARRAR